MESRVGILSTESHLYKDQHAKGLELLSLMEMEIPDELVTGERPLKRVTTPSGRPEYADYQVDFNISHTKNLVICSMAEGRTGCDIELTSRKVSTAVSEKFFHPEEKAFMADAQSEEEKRRRFMMLWVLKEAHIKLMGTSVANLKETPAFLIEKNTIKCIAENPFYYALYEGGGYVMATAFVRKEDRDNLKIKKYSEVPDFALTAVN